MRFTRTSLSIIGAALASLVLYFWFASQGTWSFFPVREREAGAAFDHLAINLSHGDPSIHCDILAAEAQKIGDKCYMYYGPWPALIRAPFLAFGSIEPGNLSTVSAMLAGLFIVIGCVALLWDCAKLGTFDGFSYILGALLGTPILFLFTSPGLFHEPYLWGMVGTLGCAAAYIRACGHPPHTIRWLFLSSCCFGIALLSRLSMGITAGVFLLALVVMAIVRVKSHFSNVALALIPAFCAAGFQAWYNHARYGSVFQMWGGTGTEVSLATSKVLFSTHRLADHIRFYFGTTPSNFYSDFPFIRMTIPAHESPQLFHHFREPLLPLTTCSPWLVLAAIISLWIMLKRKKIWATMILLTSIVSCAPILMHLFSTHRYSSEFIPPGLFAFALLLQAQDKSTVSRPIKILISMLILFSIYATITSTGCWVASWAHAPWVNNEFRAKMSQVLPSCGKLLSLE